MKIACLEEIAFRLGFIDRDQVMVLAKSLKKSGYGNYPANVVPLNMKTADDAGRSCRDP
jgi:glucose-1-phosphate thymidylyltransferase